MKKNMNAIEILEDEHEQILAIINVSGIILCKNSSAELPVGDLQDVVAFIRNFADKYHHVKEEDVLFAEMVKQGMSADSGPIAVMLHEHNLGRSYVKQVQEGIDKYVAGDFSAYYQIKDYLQAYAALLSAHIEKENNILYPMAERLLPANVMSGITGIFENLISLSPDNEDYSGFLKLVNKLSIKYLNK